MSEIREDKLYLSPPHMSAEGYERDLVEKVFDSNWIAPVGPDVTAFEREFGERIGVKYTAALS